jgi:glycosyltransferase involved in cell wall biosynthesis
VRLTFETLRECTPEPVSVLVADNGSTDGTFEYLSTLDWLDVVPLDHRRAERNAPPDVSMHGPTLDWLVKQVETPYVVTMDSDVEFYEPGWLTALLRCTAADPNLAAVGELEPGIGGYAPRLAPYLLLLRAEVPAQLNVAFRGFSNTSDPDEVRRLQAIGPRWRLDESELLDFPNLRVYSTGAVLFEAMQRRGLAWADTPPAVRRMYRHIGHQSWGDRPEDAPGQAEFARADAASREYVRNRLSARAH